MRAYEEQITVQEDGVVELERVPVKVGDRVRVILLLPDEVDSARKEHYPLRGLRPYRFDDPTAPVTSEVWELSE